MTIAEFRKTKRDDRVELPSGAIVDLLSFNAHACKTQQDGFALMSVLQEKIIEIEYQIDCYGQGFHPDGSPLSPSNPPPVLWEPRAKKAMAWAKLQKAEVQQIMHILAKRDGLQTNADKHRALCVAFVDVARDVIGEDMFHQIMNVAKEMKSDVV